MSSPVPEILALKAKSFPKSRQILDVLRCQNFKWAVPPNLVPTLCLPSGTSLGKVFLGYSSYPPIIIGAHSLNFKPIIDSIWNKILWSPVSVEGCASKIWLFSSRCKNLGRQHPLGAKKWSFKKLNLGEYDLILRCLKLLNQFTGLFSSNVGGMAVDQVLVRFWISSSVPELFATKV